MYSCVDLLFISSLVCCSSGQSNACIGDEELGSVVWYAKNYCYGLLSVLVIS